MAKSNWTKSLIPIWLTLCLAGGCASSPTPDPWADVEVVSEAATQPLPLPAWPEPTEWTDDRVTFDLDGARTLKSFQNAAEANTVIAMEHAQAIDQLQLAVEHLTTAGKAQRQIAEMRREILEDERRRHLFEKGSLYVLLVLIVGAAATN